MPNGVTKVRACVCVRVEYLLLMTKNITNEYWTWTYARERKVNLIQSSDDDKKTKGPLR